jgi:signal transduction histidine kinase
VQNLVNDAGVIMNDTAIKDLAHPIEHMQGGPALEQSSKHQDFPAQALLAPASLSAMDFSDGSPIPTFVINADHIITHWNKACERMLGRSTSEMVGTSNHWQSIYAEARPVLADLIVDGTVEEVFNEYYQDKFRPAPFIPGAYEAEGFFPHLGENGLWLIASAAPLKDAEGKIVGAIEVIQDITQRKIAELNLHQAQLDLEKLIDQRTAQLAQANVKLEDDLERRQIIEAELLRRNAELTELNAKLSMAQEQLVQSEKLASIGQLAAGVAHEINNPIGYIFSNFNTLASYIDNLFAMLTAYENAESSIRAPDVIANLNTMRTKVELNFLKEDIPVLMSESREGIVRVRKIVQDLKDFSRVHGTQDWQWANLHQGIDSTLNIVANEVKYKADVVKDYGDIPDIECLPSQINQVVMNMVVNAAHAISNSQRGTVTIKTRLEGENVTLEISDTGGGISRENLSRIFDPFFTTKPVGQGTGLGLSLSYGIIQKHHGRIDVDSELGKGTRFRISLPIRHTPDAEESKEAVS